MAQQRLEYAEIHDADAEDATKIHGDNEAIEKAIEQEFLKDDDATRWKINIGKVEAKSKDLEHCFYCTPEDFPIADRLRDEYGPGVYNALVYKNGKLTRRLTYRIAAPVSRPSAQPSQITEIGHMMARQNEQIAALARGTPTQAPDPMGMFTAMMAAIASAKEIFAPAPQAPTGGVNSLKELVETMALLKDLTGEKDGSETNAFDLLKEAMRSPVVSELAEQLRSERLQKAKAPQMLQSTPTPAIQGPRPNPREIQDPPVALAGLDQVALARLQAQIDFWVTKARKGASSQLYADVAIDNYAPEILRGMVLREDLKEIAVALNPACNDPAIWQWFEELRDEIAVLLDEPDEFDGLTNDDDGEQEANAAIAPPHVFERPDERDAPVNPNGNPVRSSGSKGDASDHVGTHKGRKKTPDNKAKSG